jgi:hypothetical protein
MPSPTRLPVTALGEHLRPYQPLKCAAEAAPPLQFMSVEGVERQPCVETISRAIVALATGADSCTITPAVLAALQGAELARRMRPRQEVVRYAEIGHSTVAAASAMDVGSCMSPAAVVAEAAGTGRT